MGRSSRRSRSRSESRERGSSSTTSKKKKSDKDKKKISSSSSSAKNGGGVGGGSRSRSRERGGKSESSSRRGGGGGHHDRERDRSRDRDRDRDRDRHHRDKDRKGSGRSRRDDDGDRRDGSRDRKRSRGSDRDGRRRGGDDRGSGGNPDEMWKRKLRDEDEQLKELDLDSLMVDEEEEERRLAEQRRKRKEKLEALQKRKKAQEETAVTVTTTTTTTSSAKPSPQSQDNTANEDLATTNNGGGYQDDASDSDEDAGPIEITKQASQDGGELVAAAATGGDEDEARNGAAAVPGGGQADADGSNAAANKGNGAATGMSSSELRAQQGKEDRPVFDMFSAAALPATAGGPGGKMGGKGGGAHGMSFLGEDGGGDQGNWTDVEGYYKTRVGEVIGGRYTVLGSVGQGVFSTVLKCLDTRAGPAAVGGGSEVALKMIRNNDTMRKAAQKEVALLKELAEHDPLNKKHCIRLLCSLEHKQHVVMVFESMQMNLRETLKKFGRKTGINIHAVQKYGKQLLAALKHMASRNLVHADIKPDNILVDQGFGSLKLADFGSAFRITDPDNDPTPYLVSRWYRAPEIVMGLEYDKAIDLWSVAVTLFELYKGSPVLPGVNNNEMLKRMMEFKGPVPTRMVKSHMRAFETMGGIRPHFTEGGQFMQQEPDPVSGQTTVRLVTVTAPSRPIKSDIMRSKGAQDKKETVADLADFLDKCMALDPKQRISLGQCSAHSFLRRA